MAKHPQTLFTLRLLHECLDAFVTPDDRTWLGSMLAQKYSTYKLPHRKGFLQALLDGSADKESDPHKQAIMVLRATHKLGKDFDSLNAEQQKQVAQNYGYKLRELAVRTLFLRALFRPDGTRKEKVIVKDVQVKATYKNVALSLLPAFRHYGLKEEAVRKIARFR